MISLIGGCMSLVVSENKRTSVCVCVRVLLIVAIYFCVYAGSLLRVQLLQNAANVSSFRVYYHHRAAIDKKVLSQQISCTLQNGILLLQC